MAVQDTGIGIPADQLERIFDRFAQVDSGPNRRYEGAGIGLALVKELVTAARRLHRGLQPAGPGQRVSRPAAPLAAADPGATHCDRRQVDLPTGAASSRRGRRPRRPGCPSTWTARPGSASSETPPAPGRRGRRPGCSSSRTTLTCAPTCCAGWPSTSRSRPAPTGARRWSESLAAGARLIVADVMMPELSGVRPVPPLKADPDHRGIPIILITARKGVDRTLEGFKQRRRRLPDQALQLPGAAGAHPACSCASPRWGASWPARRRARCSTWSPPGWPTRCAIRSTPSSTRPARSRRCSPASPSAGGPRRGGELLGAIRESAGRIEQPRRRRARRVPRPSSTRPPTGRSPEAVDSTLRLLRYKHGSGAQREPELRAPRPVFGRTSQLNQVLMNLLDNAVRAAGPGGTVWVTTEQADGMFPAQGARQRARGPERASGSHLRIRSSRPTVRRARPGSASTSPGASSASTAAVWR